MFASRPSRARGLKLVQDVRQERLADVAPLAGAWIETQPSAQAQPELKVAPLAGAWIETHASAGVS